MLFGNNKAQNYSFIIYIQSLFRINVYNSIFNAIRHIFPKAVGILLSNINLIPRTYKDKPYTVQSINNNCYEKNAKIIVVSSLLLHNSNIRQKGYLDEMCFTLP